MQRNTKCGGCNDGKMSNTSQTDRQTDRERERERALDISETLDSGMKQNIA